MRNGTSSEDIGYLIAKHADDAEPFYTARLARRRGVAVVPGEPTGPQELAAALKAVSPRISLADFEGFYIVRGLASGRGGKTVEVIVGEFEREFAARAPLWTREEFARWYLSRKGNTPTPAAIAAFEVQTVSKSDTFPTSRRGDRARDAAAADDVARNAHLARTIAEQLSRRQRVLVVYGAGHAVELQVVLGKMLGTPKILRPQD